MLFVCVAVGICVSILFFCLKGLGTAILGAWVGFNLGSVLYQLVLVELGVKAEIVLYLTQDVLLSSGGCFRTHFRPSRLFLPTVHQHPYHQFVRQLPSNSCLFRSSRETTKHTIYLRSSSIPTFLAGIFNLNQMN